MPDIVVSILHDQPRIITSPARADGADLALWGGAAAGVTGMAMRWDGSRSLDEQIADSLGTATGKKSSLSKAFTHLGGGEVLAPVAIVSYGVARWQGHDEWATISADWMETLADAAIWSNITKFAFGRKRPNRGDPHRSHFAGPSFGSNLSLPSGHATTAFATAAVLSQEIRNPWVTASLYTVATGVGATRVILEKHWTSDIIAGAALGQSLGTLVANRRCKASGDDSSWFPVIEQDSAQLVWQRRF